MTDKESRTLATKVAKESNGVSVKFGRTNGHPVLHLRSRDNRQSFTIAEAWEWDEHPWNRVNAPAPEKVSVHAD